MKKKIGKVGNKKLFNKIMLCLGGVGISAAALATGLSFLSPAPDSFTSDFEAPNKIDEIWNGTSFDKDKVQQLFGTISGEENVNFAVLREMGCARRSDCDVLGATSELMSNNAGGVIQVRMGGLDWTPTFLSKDNQGNTILTLWLTNNEQDAFQEESVYTHENSTLSLYGFVKGQETGKWGLYSDWSADWKSTTTEDGNARFYPSNMYGTSYIRSVTLNNGGQYAIDNTTLSNDPGQDEYNVFAMFTMKSVSDLTDYLVTPANVAWQEKQSSLAYGGGGSVGDYPNDEWHPDSEPGNYMSDEFNYHEHNGYDAWKNDKIWLPSLAETGTASTTNGLWKTSTEQRMNYDGSTTTILVYPNCGSTGKDNKNKFQIESSYGARSGSWMDADECVYPDLTGVSACYYYVSNSYAVRPALHLNLDAAAESAGIEVPPLTWVDFAAEDYAGGDGLSEKTAFEIENAEQLALMAKEVNAEVHTDSYFKLTSDIFLGAHQWTPIGDYEYSNMFTGNFDGCGHTIYGLKMETSQGYQGLFGYASDATIKNLNLKSGTINDTTGFSMWIGSIVSILEGGTLENCCSDVYISGSPYNTLRAGGLVGNAMGGSVYNCHYTGTIRIDSQNCFGVTFAGGLIGYDSGAYVEKCMTDCVVDANYTGALIGCYDNGDITNCIARGMLCGNGNILCGPSETGYYNGYIANCFFYGTAMIDNLSLTLDMSLCWAVVNDRKIISTAANDAAWVEGWAIVPGINNNLPVQKELFAVASIVTNTTDDFVNLFKDFEVAESGGGPQIM